MIFPVYPEMVLFNWPNLRLEAAKNVSVGDLARGTRSRRTRRVDIEESPKAVAVLQELVPIRFQEVFSCREQKI
jgi:hypothetical protein